MFTSLWLASLKRQLRTRMNRNTRARNHRRHSLPAARPLVSRNAAETLEDRTLLTTFTVVNTEDSGTGSLRDAIEQANANAGADTISFDAALAGQTIVLTEEILISDDLMLVGLGADLLALDGNADSRIFMIDNSNPGSKISVEISGLNLTNGSAESGGAIYNLETLSIIDSTLSGNTASNSGGAIYSFYADLSIGNSKLVGNMAGTEEMNGHGAGIYQVHGSLTIDTSEFTDNEAIGLGGGIYLTNTDQATIIHSTFTSNEAQAGGAIYKSSGSLLIEDSDFTGNHGSGGALQTLGGSTHVSESTFSENVSPTSGGAITIFTGSLTVSATTFTENRAASLGGGVDISSGDVIIQESTFTGNQANNGGAIGMLGRGSLELVSSTLSQNIVTFDGGAVYNNGAIALTIENSTLSENLAGFSGGALLTFANTDVSVINSTIVKNEATHFSGGGISRKSTSGSFLLSNSIVAGNTSNQFSGSYTGSGNIVRSSIDGLIDPELKNNRGGRTKTHFLLEGSAAINAGDNQAVASTGLLYDQRGTGYARIYDGTVDVGAYEFNDHLLVVNTVADEVDGDYTYGNMSLREAIQLANASPFHERIEFDAGLLSGQTIVLTDEIHISDHLTIAGLGADQLTLDGNGDSRIFRIDNQRASTKISVDLSGLTFTNGSDTSGGAIYSRETLSISDSIFIGNSATQAGGGIYNFSGDLSVVNSKLIGNTTGTAEDEGSGAAICHVSGMLTVDASEFTDNEALGAGGAIYISSSVQATISHSTFSTNVANTGGAISKGNGLLIVEDCKFTENQAINGTGGAFYVTGGTTQINASEFTENVSQTSGGAIHSLDGTLTVSATTFTENRAAGLGGAVHISLADVTIHESTLTGNQGNKGGAIGMLGYGSSLELVDSTLNQNVATFDGGAIFNNGAISITVLNSTFSDNLAGFHGGAIYEFVNTTVSVINSTIINNEATTFTGGGIFRQQGGTGSFELRNSIVSGNRGGQFSGSYTGSNNVMQSSLEGLIDPVLRDNGGPTLTHALLPGSSAIDAGSNSAAQAAGLTKDQRGGIHHRIFNGTVDIGAYESYFGVLQVDSISDLDDGNYALGHLTLREAIKIANATPEVDLITFKSTLSDKTIVLRSDLLISSSMTLTGLGAELLTISGDNNSRIFTIDDGDTEVASVIDISQLNLINGTADQGGAIYNTESLALADVVLSQNAALVSGGGIYNNEGDLLLNQVQFLDNTAGEIESPGYGAGLYQNWGTLSVIDSEFRGNQSTGSGGGIYSSAADVFLISNSTFELNSSRTGGAISKTFGSLVITESSFSGNDAFEGQGGVLYSGVSSNDGIEEILIEKSLFSENTSKFEGGAIYLLGGRLTIDDSTFSDNSAELAGGAIHSLGGGVVTIGTTTFDANHSDKDGGAISLVGAGTFDLFSSTLANNSADGRGGAIFSNAIGGTGTVQNSTISGNMSSGLGSAIYSLTFATFSVVNSTIVSNRLTSVDGLGAIAVDPAFSTYSLFTINNSIVAGNDGSQISGSITGQNNLIQESLAGLIDPVLRDNGGPTRTHALLLGSAAIDAGSNTIVSSAGLVDDQRGSGYSRIVGGTVDIGALEVQSFNAQMDLRIVDEETATSSSGEANALPENLDWIDEWGSYWLEIWISTPSTTDMEILSAALELTYNTAITTAVSIEYGAAFSVNQTGTINDLTGRIENLSAVSSYSSVGDDQRVLFARIRFESTADDGVDLDFDGQSLNPQSPEFVINQSEIVFVGGAASEEIYSPVPATQIWANPYDLNDDDAINFRDLILFASVYHSIPSESNSDYSWFADFDQSNSVNFRDLVSFAGNYGKSKAGQTSVNYPQNYPEAWNQLLIVDSQSAPQANANPVTQVAAETVLESVVEQVSPQLTPSQNETLSQVDIEVVDLAGDTLGRAAAGTIYIDVNAAGRGWFVDASPADHSEFSYASDLTLIALPGSDAASQIDLWSVILHELGHLLGYDHEIEGVMQETLAPGVRNLPVWAEETDEFFVELTEDTSLITF